MSLDAMQSLPQSRTIRYRTDDQINNLRIKILVEIHDSEDIEAPWVSREQVFSWQEKVFSPVEFDKYSKMAAAREAGGQVQRTDSGLQGLLGKKKRNLNRDFLDEKYVNAVENLAQGEVIYSYVDMDSFEDVNEYAANVTTSEAEKPTKLADRLSAVEQARGKHSNMAVPFRIMHLAAELKGKRDVTKPDEQTFLTEEHVLCTIKAYQDGSVDMTPGFSPRAALKVDTMNNNAYTVPDKGVPYRIVTGGGVAYHYWVVNDTETTDPGLALRLNEQQKKYQENLFDKALELRRNFVGEEFEPFSETPDEVVLKVAYNLEIMSASGFEMDRIYVQYLLDVPEHWTYQDASSLWGNTQLSSTRERSSRKPGGGDAGVGAAAPVGSPAGPGVRAHLAGRAAGYSQQDICTWAPVPSQVGRMRSFFIGGTPELRDLTFAGVPTALGAS
eukprot:CAMPEP_0180222286 /NCGR_PEP_ID=MMETSP0987-20121128/20591_1 /TAXON_ID=697907 /ORGANISM="non described non described, Strain CCMP2293" /LENGTH=442 /DNA_ID=CAMNT_0022184287 /DNA_START=117 /DNA_END=1443 /DNA_ORIENTATION=+